MVSVCSISKYRRNEAKCADKVDDDVADDDDEWATQKNVKLSVSVTRCWK